MDTMIRRLQRNWAATGDNEIRLKLVAALERKLEVTPDNETILELYAARVETQMDQPTLTAADMKRGPRPNAGMAHVTEMARDNGQWEENPLCESFVRYGVMCIDDPWGRNRRCNVCWRQQRHRRQVVRLMLQRNRDEWENPSFVSFDETQHGPTEDYNEFDRDPYWEGTPMRFWSVTRNRYVWRESWSGEDTTICVEYFDRCRAYDKDITEGFDPVTRTWD